MRLVFAGTPVVAARTLAHLLDNTGHEVVAVVTRPDAPQGRSRRPVPSPVAELALQRGLELLRPASARDPELLSRLTHLAPDACPVIAYGALLPEPVLAVPAHGWLNVHYSLLPRWRGAAPVQRAILAGDTETGVTVFRLVKAMDAGPVFATRATPIGDAETAGELLERLTPLGADLLAGVLGAIADGTARSVEQPAAGITVAPKLTVADARLDWRLPATRLALGVRACNPSPMAWTTLSGERFRILRAEPAPGQAVPGQLQLARREVSAGTGDGLLRLLEVQPQGKPPMAAAAWANGLRGIPESFE